MATLQSISKNVDSFDDVIIQEPIKTVESKTTKTDLHNGKIQTKDLPQGIEPSAAKLEKGKFSSKLQDFTPKTKKKLGLFKKRSLEQQLQQDNDNQDTTPTTQGKQSTTTQGKQSTKTSGKQTTTTSGKQTTTTSGKHTTTTSGKHTSKTSGKHTSELGEYNFERRVSHFVNMAFENNELESSNLAFGDVVRKILSDPIKEDIHPFGRGHLYASAFDGGQPKTHHEEGKYFMWLLASLFIIGIAGSIILMSITYQPEVANFDPVQTTAITGQNTTS